MNFVPLFSAPRLTSSPKKRRRALCPLERTEIEAAVGAQPIPFTAAAEINTQLSKSKVAHGINFQAALQNRTHSFPLATQHSIPQFRFGCKGGKLIFLIFFEHRLYTIFELKEI